jgi:hypothetical protein
MMIARRPTLKIIGLMPMRHAKMLFYFSYIRLIHLAQKNLYIVIGLIAALAVLSILNILLASDYFSTSSEQVDKIVDLRLLAALIVVSIPLVLPLLRSRNVLDRWADMFERNTLIATMGIGMTARAKEEAIFGLSRSIQKISKLLQEYIDSKIILMNF